MKLTWGELFEVLGEIVEELKKVGIQPIELELTTCGGAKCLK